MNAKTFNIPIDNDGQVIERLNKLERTAARLGVSFPTVTLGTPYKTEYRDNLTGELLVHWWRPVTLEGEGIDRPVSYGGWKIIGRFNHEYPKVILNKLSPDIKPEYIQRFEDKNVSYCEHCQKQIYRNNTYVIQNEETSDQMLIGSSCMHHYVPHQKPLDAIMSYYMSIQEFFMPDEDDPEGIYCIREQKYMDTKGYLRSCFQVLLTGVGMKSDWFDVLLGHLRSGTVPKDLDIREFLNKAISFYDDAESEMYHMMAFIASLPEDNEFNVRLKRMCEPGYHLIKDNNTVRWGASKYYDYIHRPRKERPIQTSNKWIANVSDMIEVQVKLESRIFLYSSEYGDSYLFTFKTKEGDTITWKTSYIDTEFLQGDMVIRGRVKELTEYKGVKQTQVTRAKLRKM